MDVQDEFLNKLHSIEMGRRSNWNTFSEQVKELLKEYGLTVCEEIKMSEAIGDKMPPLPESGDLDKIKEYLRAFKKQQKRFEYQLSDEIGKHLYQRGAENGYLTAVFEVLKETTSKQKKKIFACIYVEILITGELSHEVLLWLIHSYRQLCTKGESTDSIAAQISGDKLDFSKIERKTAISILYALQVPLEKAEKMLTDGYGSDMFDPRSFMEMVYVYGMLHRLPYNAGNEDVMSLTRLMQRSAESVMRYLFGEFVDDALLSVCPLPPEQMLDMNRLDETAAVLALVKCGADPAEAIVWDKIQKKTAQLAKLVSIETDVHEICQHTFSFDLQKRNLRLGLKMILNGAINSDEDTEMFCFRLGEIMQNGLPLQYPEILSFYTEHQELISQFYDESRMKRYYNLGEFGNENAHQGTENTAYYQSFCDWIKLMKLAEKWCGLYAELSANSELCDIICLDNFRDTAFDLLKTARKSAVTQGVSGLTMTMDIAAKNKEKYQNWSIETFIEQLPNSEGQHFYDEIRSEHVSKTRLKYLMNMQITGYLGDDLDESELKKCRSILKSKWNGFDNCDWKWRAISADGMEEAENIVESALLEYHQNLPETETRLLELADFGIRHAYEIALMLREGWRTWDYQRMSLTRTYIHFLLFRDVVLDEEVETPYERKIELNVRLLSDAAQQLRFAMFDETRYYEDTLFYLCLTTDSPMQTFMELINDPDFAFPSVETDRIKKDLYLKD